MMFIRPVRTEDLAAILALAQNAGVGVTSLQPDQALLAERIRRSEATMAGEATLAEQGYLFVLEDSQSRQVVGLCGLEVAVGLQSPWYNYRVGVVSHMSSEFNVNRHVPTLFLSNDHTGHSELCTLFLDKNWRHSKNGQLLSKSRLLFLRAFKERFSKKVVAEMRGVSDEHGKSPFWESLGRHFFTIDFAQADYLTGVGKKAFIAELMPKLPIYTSLLTEEAQAVIGKVHAQTEPARAMLEAEGLHYQGYIDIFDGGATLEAYVDDLRMVRQGHTLPVSQTTQTSTTGAFYLISNRQDKGFRVIMAQADSAEAAAHLTAAQLDLLMLNPGDEADIASLVP